MRTWVIFIICVFPAIALSAGKSDEAEPTQLELTAADQIIKDIRDSHPPENGSFFFRTGLMQIDVNTKDAVNLNDEGVLPFVGGEFQWDIIDKLGIEIRGYYAQNSLYTSSTPEKN
ncbi:MAG: hypothetical protein KDD25_09235 [Bdellovibrionales bacterium]|nr:hypothetical protein [Bdellovibrionales bacterium]